MELAPLIFFTAMLISLVLYVYCIIHVHRNKSLSLQERRKWVNLTTLFPLVGLVMYWMDLQDQKRKNKSKLGLFFSKSW